MARPAAHLTPGFSSFQRVLSTEPLDASTTYLVSYGLDSSPLSTPSLTMTQTPQETSDQRLQTMCCRNHTAPTPNC